MNYKTQIELEDFTHEVYKYFTYETLYISSSYVFTPSIKPTKVFYQFKLFLSRFYKC